MGASLKGFEGLGLPSSMLPREQPLEMGDQRPSKTLRLIAAVVSVFMFV